MERDDKGRFATGNPGGPGRPKRIVEEEYLNATIARVPTAKWQKVIDRALAQAMNGDSEARRFLSEHLMGKPTQRTELTGANGGPVENKIDLSGLTDDQLSSLANNLKD